MRARTENRNAESVSKQDISKGIVLVRQHPILKVSRIKEMVVAPSTNCTQVPKQQKSKGKTKVGQHRKPATEAKEWSYLKQTSPAQEVKDTPGIQTDNPY